MNSEKNISEEKMAEMANSPLEKQAEEQSQKPEKLGMTGRKEMAHQDRVYSGNAGRNGKNPSLEAQ